MIHEIIRIYYEIIEIKRPEHMILISKAEITKGGGTSITLSHQICQFLLLMGLQFAFVTKGRQISKHDSGPQVIRDQLPRRCDILGNSLLDLRAQPSLR